VIGLPLFGEPFLFGINSQPIFLITQYLFQVTNIGSKYWVVLLFCLFLSLRLPQSPQNEGRRKTEFFFPVIIDLN
jgi:hypothetical protein